MRQTIDAITFGMCIQVFLSEKKRIKIKPESMHACTRDSKDDGSKDTAVMMLNPMVEKCIKTLEQCCMSVICWGASLAIPPRDTVG